MIDARLQRFTSLLRENGIRVSTSELLDAGAALSLVGLEERSPVLAALRATLVKREGDIDVFDRLFAAFFGGLDPVVEAFASGFLDALAQLGVSPDELERIVGALDALREDQGPFAQALLDHNRGMMAQLLHEAALQIDFSGLHSFMQQGQYTRRLLGAAGVGEVEGALAGLRARLAGMGLSEDVLRAWDDATDAQLATLREAARRYVQEEYRRRFMAQAESPAGRLLEERPLYTLTREELERMKGVVERMAERLRDRIVRRRKVQRRGHFDVQKTLRRNLRYGGVPLVPVFRKKKRDKPDLVVLVDVSDSVRNTARFFLQFAHALHDVFDRVRSFVFVSDLGESTALFKEADVHRAIDLAFTGRVVSLYANSNYGRALRIFHRDHLSTVTSRTTVFILGDGRNNYNPPEDWVVAEIRRRARRTVWLCPEDRRSWGFGDSQMPLYARHCDHAEVVQRISDLRRIVERVLV